MQHRTYIYAIIVLLAGCGPSGPPVTSGPFVQMDADGEPVVIWSTAQPAPSEVAYGPTNDLNIVARVSGERTDHRVQLPSVRPGLVYFYQVAAQHEVDTFRSGVRFTRPPYLQHVTPTEATILWRSNGSGPGSVAVTTDDTVMTVAESSPGRVRLQELASGNTYMYCVQVEGVSSEEGRLRTVDPDESELVVALFGDSRDNPAVVRQLSDAMRAHEPDIVLHSGDFVVDARNAEEWDPQFFDPAAILLRNAPVYPAIGNHEHDDRSYYDAFEVPENGSDRPEAWYSIRRGPVHLTVLDTNPVSGLFAPGTEQLKWLVNDLRTAEADWKIVMFHHPFYSSGRHKSNEDLRQKLMPLFEEHDVDLLLTGHDHCYERTWPLVDGKRDESGIVHVVSGGGGAVLYPVGRSDWTAVSESAFHYCMMKVRPDRIEVDVRALDETEIDAFTLGRDSYVENLASKVASDPSPDVIRALGRTGDRRCLDRVAALASSTDVELRRAVAEALSRIGTTEALTALVTLSGDGDAEVRRWATRGLAYVDAKSSSPPLVGRLADTDPDTRRFAAIGLRLVPHTPAVAALVAAGNDPAPAVRLAVVQALRYYDTASARKAIIARLEDADTAVRSMAISAIVETGIARESVGPLAKLLPGESDEEKIRILQLLGETKDPGAVEAMTGELKRSSTSVKRRAAIELGNLKRMEAVPALIDALDDSDRGVKQFAWRALRVITGERHPAEAAAWRSWFQSR